LVLAPLVMAVALRCTLVVAWDLKQAAGCPENACLALSLAFDLVLSDHLPYLYV